MTPAWQPRNQELLTRGAAFSVTMVLRSMLLAALVVGVSRSEDESPDMRLRLAIGPTAAPVTSGTVWLFHYGWGRLDSLKLAEIGREPLRIVLTPQRSDSAIPPQPDTEGWVAAVELPGPLWYRTADMSRDDFLRDFETFFWSLGARLEDPPKPPTLVLPDCPRRIVRFLDPDGVPVSGRQVDLSLYLTDHNHCGVHHGLPLGRLTTDERGEITVKAPLVDLYLDGLWYYEDQGPGPWGPMFSGCVGLRLGPKPVEVVRKAWEFPQREISITVLDERGRPLAGINLVACDRSSECGTHCGSLWKTDENGRVAASFAPETTESLSLESPELERPLTDAEIRELFEKGSLTVRLPTP